VRRISSMKLWCCERVTTTSAIATDQIRGIQEIEIKSHRQTVSEKLMVYSCKLKLKR
jgi:hypothetical protein